MATTFTRLSGHGLLVTPRAEFRIEPSAGTVTTLDIASADGRSVVDVAAVARGEANTASVDVAPGGVAGPWRVETNVFTCAWPAGFAVSSDPDGLSAFLMLGANDAMLWVAGPLDRDKALPIEKLAAEDQTVRAIADLDGNTRIDLDYVVEDELWWQRRYALAWRDDTVLVVTAQARVVDEDSVRAAVDALASSIAPYHAN
jgi:hypothetical protein